MAGKLTFVFLIDALGWNIVERFGFARDLLSRRAPLGTVLGYSSAAIPSLLSGAEPSQHQCWSMYKLSRGRSPFGYLRHLPRLPHALEWRTRLLTRRITDWRGVVKGYYDLYEIPLSVLGHFDVASHGDPFRPGGLSVETVFDRFVADGVKYRLWYYRTPEADNFAESLAAIDSPNDVLFVYTAELDALMHRVGTQHDEVATRLKRYEEYLERVMERARAVGREIEIYLLSDHGMTDVTRAVDVWGGLQDRGYKVGKDYLGFLDSTMARLWCDEAVTSATAEILGEKDAGRLLSEQELREFSCYFPGYEYGKQIFVANPGVVIVPSFMGSTMVAAMHGYDPTDTDSLGCMATTDMSGELPASILGFKRYLLQRRAEYVG